MQQFKIFVILLLMALSSVYGQAYTKGWEDMLKDPEGNNTGRCIAKTQDGGYIVVSERTSYSDFGDYRVIKLRGDGTVQWDKTYGGQFDDRPYCVVQTKD
ncbi:MAG: hypothetical protein JST26_16795 [Bacteroidetes bacterium]|nr:hypothetical protein [Bacteroidota bacterium]